MTEDGGSGNIEESFVEDASKVDIEETSVNLDCVKKETLELEEDSYATRYRITLGFENISGALSNQIQIEEGYDNLIGFLDNDVIMENTMIKLEAIKEEDDGSFNNFYCSKCKEIYKCYCMKCSTLLCILNNNSTFVNSGSESNTTPTDILEIRNTPRGKGVYLLRAVPINIIFGPFEGVLGIESIVGHSWKIICNKFGNIQSGNWMKNIVCAASASLKNLDIFQIDGNLYFQTTREITEGEELLIYYDDKKLQQLDTSEEYLYTPQKLEKLPKIFACTVCCLGFGSNKCLMEHKRKSCRMEHNRNMIDFLLIECHYCKMWMEKWEHEEYHFAYCLEKHHRMWSDYSEAVHRNDTDVEEMEDDCGTRAGKRRYRREICSRPYDPRDQSDAKDYQCFSGANHDIRLNEHVLVKPSNKEQIQNTIETHNKNHFHNQANKRRGIKSLQCDICMTTFTYKSKLKRHIRNKHTYDESAKDYQCLECSHHTNSKSNFQRHLNTHSGIKPFKCDICKTEFTLKHSLKAHIRNKHTKNGCAKDYKCSECSFDTNYKSSFQMHMNKHRGIKPFKCDICMKDFGQRGQLTAHIQNKHSPDGIAKDYKCSECAYQTNCAKQLKTHIKYNHTDDGSLKDYKCLECSYQTHYKTNLQDHVNMHRGIKPFKCHICMKSFTQKGQLKVHIKVKHTDDGAVKDYKCSECTYQTNYKSVLQMHINKHRGIKPLKLFKCEICMEKFGQKGQLKIHIKGKHADDGNVKDYKCLECSYRTNYKYNLNSHLNKHRGIKRFQCDICKKKFGQKAQIKVHIRNIHTDDGGVKDYKCLQCSYQTNYKSSFQTHLNKHRGIKPFQCDICKTKFTDKSNLNTHIKNKHRDDGDLRDYKCSECSYATNYKSRFQTHLNMHKGIKPFTCDICMAKFTEKSNLKEHVKKQHTNDRNAK